MIRAHNHSSYPRAGESPLDQQIRGVRKALQRGKATEQQVREVEDEVATVIVAEQARAFIDVVTDGMLRWDGPHSYLARHVDGLRTGALRRWFDSNFYDRRLVVEGPLSRRGPFLVHDFGVAQDVAAKKPVKPVLPGPVSLARLSNDRHYGDLDSLADAFAEVLAEEVADLAQAGARVFQLEEPLLCRHPQDLDRVVRTSARVFASAGAESTTILSTYFGDLDAIADELERIPGTHIGLDLVSQPKNFELLRRLPAGRGVALGLFDARSTIQEDAADVAGLLEPYRDCLSGRDLLVGPNCGLEFIPRDQAFDKLLHARYLVEKLSEEWTWD